MKYKNEETTFEFDEQSTDDKFWEEENLNIVYKKLEKYKPLVRRQSFDLLREFKNIPLDREDIENKLMSVAVERAKDYDPSKGYTLGNYLKMILRTAGINYCKSYNTSKFYASNTAIEFDDVNTFKFTIDESDELKDQIIGLIENNSKVFKPMELMVLRMYLENSSKCEIAEGINKSEKSVYKYLDSASEKFKKLWSERFN